MNLSVNRHLARALAAILLCSVAQAKPAFAEPVEDYSGYEPQETCSATALPGTEFLVRYLARKYPGTSYSSTVRSCGSGGTSEHKDGRALDWPMDANNAQHRALVDDFLETLFATDGRGNQHAIARRMGIMYVIWNDHSYSSYNRFEKRDYLSSSCPSRQRCSKTLRHRDHVHISLSRSGAAAQTSYYRARGVESVPVLIPGTVRLDHERTAEVRFEVPATGRTIRSDFKLVRGTTYRIVADGLFRYGAGARVADAACTWTRQGWTAGARLRVNGTNPWSADCEAGRHTHTAYYTAKETDYLRLRLPDDSPADNQGSLTVSILREDLPARTVASRIPAARPEPRPARKNGPSAKALKDERVTVRAASARGTLTERAFRKGRTYKVVVTGTARSGSTVFDGNCVRYAGRFRPQHSFYLPRPDADHLSLFIQGVRISLRVPGSSGSCDGRDHRYVGTFKPVVSGASRVKIWEPFSHQDNAGGLVMKIKEK